METFSRFGNMFPPEEYMQHPYMLDRDPIQIADNLYYVGNLWCASHLIDTGDGLLLLDTPCTMNLPGLLGNIAKLGFNVTDVKHILISHAHTDHYGAVNALKAITGAKTYMGQIDAEDMHQPPEYLKKMNQSFGAYNEFFTPDVELEDGEHLVIGNTDIRCVVIPGHTRGTMAHFWETTVDGVPKKVGIYGGAGFGALSYSSLKNNAQPLALRKQFSESIRKVWDEEVDLMLGNHPFHNDVYQKGERVRAGEKDAFLDASEWKRFLGNLEEEYRTFLEMTEEEITEWFRESHLMEYYGLEKKDKEENRETVYQTAG